MCSAIGSQRCHEFKSVRIERSGAARISLPKNDLYRFTGSVLRCSNNGPKRHPISDGPSGRVYLIHRPCTLELKTQAITEYGERELDPGLQEPRADKNSVIVSNSTIADRPPQSYPHQRVDADWYHEPAQWDLKWSLSRRTLVGW